MVSTGPLTDERYLALAGDAAEGVEGLSLWPDPVTSDLPGVKLYREHMQRYFPKNEPNRYSIAGYFAAMLFAEGAKRAGRNLTRESLMAALESRQGIRERHPAADHDRPRPRNPEAGILGPGRERALQAADGLAQVRVGRCSVSKISRSASAASPR